jgi:hypothetical protein
MSRRAQICPACRRPFPPRLVVHGPVRQAIVNTIAERPDGITRAELLDVVYGDDIDGGPDNANVISVLIKHANAELAAQGFHIESTWRGRGARYRLTKIEPNSPQATIDGILHGFHNAQLKLIGSK